MLSPMFLYLYYLYIYSCIYLFNSVWSRFQVFIKIGYLRLFLRTNHAIDFKLFDCVLIVANRLQQRDRIGPKFWWVAA